MYRLFNVNKEKFSIENCKKDPTHPPMYNCRLAHQASSIWKSADDGDIRKVKLFTFGKSPLKF